MKSDLKAMAGAAGTEFEDEQRAACIAELKPVVQSLVRKGMPAYAIVAALADVSFFTLDLGHAAHQA